MATEDGWEPSPRIEPDSPLLVWKQVPGTVVTLQVRDDDAGTVMLAYAADYHTNVEALRDPDSACYTPTNSVSTSNHLNATAMDFNWESHPFQTRGTFTAAQMGALRDLLKFYDGIIFWAGDWDDPVDEMHHQMDYGSYDLERQGKLAAWIKANIRPDGFSVYKRGAPAPAPVSSPTDAAVKALYDAVPVIDMDHAAVLVDAVMAGLAASQCTNVKRIAMWLAQIGEESGGFVYTEEIAKNGRYAPYIGRTWIQITWQSNYAAFGKWCLQQGLLTDADYFVNNPAALADPKWAAVGPAWYWTVQQPRLNEFADAGNVEDASKAINAPAWIGDPTKHANGIDDRTARYQQAIALGDELLALIQPTTPSPPTGGGPLMALTDDEQQEILDAVRYIRDQMGPREADWTAASSLGTNASGGELTLRDGLAELKRTMESPEVAIVTFQTQTPPAK